MAVLCNEYYCNSSVFFYIIKINDIVFPQLKKEIYRDKIFILKSLIGSHLIL